MCPFIDEMRRNISDALLCGTDRISIKATTEEGMGFTGKKEGIAAYSICLLEK
jgi:2-C-methyl-D-erythritol 2,4-cyclodiphosphate synthase